MVRNGPKIITLAVVTLAAFGCSAASQSPAAAAVVTVTATTATPTPVVTPTPETPAPAIVTPGPPTQDQRYTAFVNNAASEVGHTVTALGKKFMDHMSAQDWTDAAQDAQNLASWAVVEKTWLDDHQPSSCYRDQWLLLNHAVNSYRLAYSNALVWLDAYPVGNQAAFNAYMSHLSDGNAFLAQANAVEMTTAAACTSASGSPQP